MKSTLDRALAPQDVNTTPDPNELGGDRLDWLIVGGGIHGVHIAARLIGDAGVAAKRLRLVDPADALLSRWRQCTAATGMRFLRSPGIHHLDPSPWSLNRFAGKRRQRKGGLFAPPYDRPSLALFDRHCDHVMETFGLHDLHIKARALECSIVDNDVLVRLSDGHQHIARRIVLALGNETPCWPAWAPRDHPRIDHVFQSAVTGPRYATGEHVAIVGGGISAAQVALRLGSIARRVHLLCRHPLRRHQFDSDPGWLGPKRMAGFLRVSDLAQRRTMINGARHRGSVPPAVLRRLKKAIERDTVRWHQTGVEAVEAQSDHVVIRTLDGSSLAVDRLVLATGLAPVRPGGALVDDLVTSLGLPTAGCGFPVTDRALRWHPRIHVTGALAELELGPVARNIAGARRAAERIVAMSRAEEAA